jgi:hypothetical protein
MLPQEIKSRIAGDAEKKFPRNEKAAKELTTRVWAEKRGYIAGSEEEAQRAQILYDCLLKIRHNHYTQGAIDKKIDEALTNYNNSK